MQLLTTNCPYCQSEVETTLEHVDGPVVCPKCNKPFEMEMPVATVTSVREVEAGFEKDHSVAGEPAERELLLTHPAMLRAAPFWSLLASIGLVAAVIGIVLGLFFVAAVSDALFAGAASWVVAASAILALVAAGYFFVLFLQSRFATLTVTDERTIYREGIISRNTSEVQHDDVSNIQLDQSFSERLIGVGTIGISSSGQDDVEVIAKGIPNPGRVIELVRENQRA